MQGRRRTYHCSRATAGLHEINGDARDGDNCKERDYAEAPESLISKIGTGTPALIRVHALPDKQFKGKVSRLSPTVDPKTRTLRAEIALPNPEARLLPGMTCTVTFRLEK